MLFYKLSEKKQFPELNKLKPDFYLNHLGNMKFCSIGYLFPTLMLKQLLRINDIDKPVNQKRKKAIEHRIQIYVNMGAIEVAVSNRNQFAVSKDAHGYSFRQKRVQEIINRGFSSYSNRYKEVMVGNDFASLHCPLECFKLITKNVTSHEHQAYGKSDVGFLDPCYTCDGENVGRVLSLCKNVIISWISIPSDEILNFISHDDINAEEEFGDYYSCLMINFDGEIIRRKIYMGKNTILALKRKFVTIEILKYDDFVCINSLPSIVYKKCKDGLYYTPQELSRYTGDELLNFINNEMFSSILLPIPFLQHNVAPKIQYAAITNKQAAQLYLSERVKYSSPTKMWSLVYPQTPFFTNCFFPLFTVWCTVACMCIQGLNQEDGIVVKRSSVERGLFMTERYGHYKLSYTRKPDEKMFVMMHVRPGEIMHEEQTVLEICNITSLSTFHIELKIECMKTSVYLVHWKSEDKRKLFNIYRDKKGNTITIVTHDCEKLTVGNKVVSNSGQKCTVTAIVDDVDLPSIISEKFSGVPDMFLHPASLKRQTMSMFYEGVNREQNAKTKTLKDYSINQTENGCSSRKSVSFPYLEYSFDREDNTTDKLANIIKESYSGKVYCGITGRLMKSEVSVLNMSFQILPQHNAKEKEYCIGGNARRNNLTGQMVRGRSHNGALGLSNMETEILVGHGAISTLENLLFERSDDIRVMINPQTYIRVGASSQRFLDDLRLFDLAPSLNIAPTISETTKKKYK
jgi:hypothetical protein